MRCTLLVTLLVTFLVACGGNYPPSPEPSHPRNPDPIPHVDPRGPRTIALAGGANGLLWDARTSTLYLTDNNAGTLLTFSDAAGIQTAGTFPAATAGISLGDLIQRADGTILTTSFGFGKQGTLFAIANKTSSALTGLDPARRRIGLAQDEAGTVYEAYFTGGGGKSVGAVATVAINGGAATETEIAGTGFKKLVGIVATTTAVFVSDQADKTIYKLAVPGFAVTPVATAPSVDLLASMPNGDLLTGGSGLHRITQTGTVTDLFPGQFESVRGIAYDPALKRLFLVDHSTTVGTPDKLQIRPLDP